MTPFRPFPLALALALGLAGTSAVAADPVMRVGGEPALAAKATPAVTWRTDAFPEARVARTGLPALAAERILEVQKRNARGGNIPAQIGVGRALAAGQDVVKLQWQPAAGGRVARFEVSAADAVGLRLGLDLNGLPSRAEIRVAGSADPLRIQAMGAAQAQALLSDGLFWTSPTDGERQLVELFVPSGERAPATLRVGQLSHLLASPGADFDLSKAVGDSGSCNINVACRTGTLGQRFVNAKNAVARMAYVSGGSSYTCTGTLLNDTVTATQIPYFYSAHHCIGNQSEANTLVTYWGFEASTCGGTTPAANVSLSGGATYLWSDANTDALLLRLNGTPPAGAFYSGWDATQITNGTAVRAIHHPSGDLKKTSLGQKMTQDTVNIEVAWTEGTTEGGSSGSGLFTDTGSEFLLRGGLYGGNASCANTGNVNNNGNRDWYSRLDVAYPSIQQWLAPAAANPLPTRTYTGAWYVPAEPGWGLTAFQFNNAAQNLFVLFFMYDETGKAQWYELDGGWSATDVRSGNLLRYAANPWTTTFNPAARTSTPVGTGSLTFTSETSATLTFTANGVTRTVTLSKI